MNAKPITTIECPGIYVEFSPTLLEARKLSRGFSVILIDEEYYPRGIRIGVTRRAYDWRIFAAILKDNHFYAPTDDERENMRVKGEAGIRAEALKLGITYTNSPWRRSLDWLLIQNELSIDALDAILEFPLCDDTLDKLGEIDELAACLGGDPDFLQLHHQYFPGSKTYDLEALCETMTKAWDKTRQARIAAFKNQIEKIACRFSSERGRWGPSQRTTITLFLEDYVARHRSMPKGKVRVQTPNHSMGEVDFDEYSS